MLKCVEKLWLHSPGFYNCTDPPSKVANTNQSQSIGNEYTMNTQSLDVFYNKNYIKQALGLWYHLLPRFISWKDNVHPGTGQ